MLRVGQYQIGTTLGGMEPLCDVLKERKDPDSMFQEYAEAVGTDLTGALIEAGFPMASWRWERLSQNDFNTLIGYLGAVYIRTRENSGGGSEDYSTYNGIMARPKGTFSSGEWLDVSADFTMLVLVP